MLSYLPHRVRAPILNARQNRSARGILDTPPIQPADDGVVLFSMIGTAVLLPYLVAVKSLWTQVRRGRVVIMDDGSLTDSDRAILADHCGNPEVFPLKAVDTGAFPKGGTWERLLTIVDRRKDDYWVQLDSDTVTLGPVPEVVEAIAANRSFTLMGDDRSPTEPLTGREFAARFHPGGHEEGHVQNRIESRLGMAPTADILYLRGCSGFAGFARSADGRQVAGRVAQAMAAVVGQPAMEIWGTEQVASSYIVANDPDPVGLPHSRYVNYWGEPYGAAASFVHFVGPHRHDNGAYARATRQVIQALRGA
jgi:hypothetical protein